MCQLTARTEVSGLPNEETPDGEEQSQQRRIRLQVTQEYTDGNDSSGMDVPGARANVVQVAIQDHQRWECRDSVPCPPFAKAEGLRSDGYQQYRYKQVEGSKDPVSDYQIAVCLWRVD